MVRAHRWARMGLLALALAGLMAGAACSDDDDVSGTGGGGADAVATIRLAIGPQTITVTRSGTITGSPIVIGSGPTAVTATFLDASGGQVSGLGSFEVRVTPANTQIVTFTRTSAFAGTLTRVATIGQTTVAVGLWDTDRNRFEVGPFNIQLNVQ